MWHWLPSLPLKGYRQFWSRLLFFSVLGHLALLFFGLFYRRSDNVKVTIFSQTRPTEVIFVPLYKKFPEAQKRIAQGSKLVSATGLAHQKKPKAAVKVVSKVAIKPAVKPSTVKIASKAVPKKTNLKIKQQAVKMKAEAADKKIAPTAETKIKPATEIPSLTEPIYIGRHDLQNLQMVQELEAVIVKSWQPPAGFGADVECTVELAVDEAGRVSNFLLKKSSNILVYDLSVRRIFAQIILPQSVRKKTLTIVFKQ